MQTQRQMIQEVSGASSKGLGKDPPKAGESPRDKVLPPFPALPLTPWGHSHLSNCQQSFGHNQLPSNEGRH